MTIADSYEKANITTNVEKNKEVTLLSLYKYPVNRYLSIVSGEGTIKANKLTLKSDEMKVAVNYPSITNTISGLNKEESGLKVDDTTDKNLRYVGASPKNYITFNDETWRIIGIFNVYNTETGKYEKLTKIIRNESLGRYSWDTTASTINNGQGINEWSKADLMTELNTDYIDISKTSGTTYWYNDKNNAKNGSYDYSKNIKSTSIEQIANVRWNLGGASSSASALSSYTQERGTTHVSNPADGVTRTNTWDGKIGLMYPSDYGYASSSETCRSNMNSSTNSVPNCKENNWLFDGNYQWTLTSRSNNVNYVFYAHSVGLITDYSSYYNYGVRPALFLKSDVVITGGTGDEKDPYTVSNYNAFRDDSWATIAVKVKVNPAAYAVGTTKKLKVYDNPNGETTNGTYKEYTVRVANNTTPAECNDSNFSQTACGFVVEFVDIVENRRMNSTNTNAGGWRDSAMRTYANVEFFNKLPIDLQKVITDTNVISGHGGTTGETNFTSTDKIYLLSAHEVYEDVTSKQVSRRDKAYDKTRQLDYYKNLGVTTISYSGAIKKINGSSSFWWLRAADSYINNNFLVVSNNGNWDDSNAGNTTGFAPAFRIGEKN